MIQNIYEVRMVEIETQLDEFKADIKLLVKDSTTQQQIFWDIQAIQNKENIKNLQNTIEQMIQVLLQ